MIEIFALHGVVDRVRSGSFCHLNMVEADRLRALLCLKRKFVPLSAALEGRGRALTIDDATEAAARTALLARHLGHAVTLFVNPWQVEDGRAYAFSWLSALVDQIDQESFHWNGQAFELASLGGKQAFRAAVKRLMRRQVLPEQNYEVLEQLRAKFAIERVDIPAHLSCLSLEQLRQLQDEGVDIENHYWSHLDPAAHTHAQFVIDWRRAQEWLGDSLGVRSKFFASPFGEFLPPREFLRANDIVCLLLHSGHPAGAFDATTVNRFNLT
jgi:peptidoglycan/xylan/chitin deacetylase (PgdA/CDA1 family)